jgi:FKBP-type peptidyl-prolyl cis-trans isomerase FklB
MRTTPLIGFLALALPFGGLFAAESINLEDETARINYSLGYQIGGDFKRQNVKMDAQAVIKGIEDALSGTKPLMEPEDMHNALRELKQKVVAQEREQRRSQELQNSAADQQFLQDNKNKPGVTTTTSGLQYQILAPGKGKSPKPTDTVTVNYRGTLTNGHEFDSSYRRGEPAAFPLNNVIKGWTEGLQLIKEGGKIQLVIPPELAYADRGPLAHRVLIFEVELVSVTEPDKTTPSKTSAPKNPQ